ncbi:MAG: TPR domain protein, putative component of TonB system [Ktedonobacterales bacterium]|jgi:tetratricopeptide (TPR) repeat protein|nr:MAG: TPR domain protein, putative component of TonB system [Ktedonobacterales bacterium]
MTAIHSVFISSTFFDLELHRARVREDLLRMRQFPTDMVYFGAGEDATTVSLERVAAAEFFVLIVAWRYGTISTVPPGETRSITHQEYDTAVRLGKKIFVYLSDPATEQDNSLFPFALRDLEHTAQLRAFRAHLEDPNVHTADYFTTPADLGGKVSTRIADYLLHLPLDGGGIGQSDALLAAAEETRSGVRDLQQRMSRDDLPLVPARTFTLNTMGDDAAASRPYVRVASIGPLLDDTIATLRACAQGASPKHGLLVTGESNAGKTRFALEALHTALPDWDVLEWTEAYPEHRIPATERLTGRKLIIFLDDLQNYVPAATHPTPTGDQAPVALASSAATTLRALDQRLRAPSAERQTLQTLIIATCRSERLTTVRNGLDWLFNQLDHVAFPTFDPNESSAQAQAIIAALAADGEGRIEHAQWDGTIGSVVLGLGDKRAAYEMQLTTSARGILHAMKLLFLVGVPAHTSSRLKAICADPQLFALPELATSTPTWDAALDELLRYQFVTTLPSAKDDLLLRIRKDPAYYTDVIADYPQPYQRERDLKRLQQVFAATDDAEALSSLGTAWYNAQRYDEALAVLEQALALNPRLYAAWCYKGGVLAALRRNDEALAAFWQAIALDPKFAPAWYNLGNILGRLKRYDEELAAFDRALALDPTLAAAWTNKGAALANLRRYEEALAAYQQTVALDRTFARAWRNLAYLLLNRLHRYDDALDACQHATSEDAASVGGWMLTGQTLQRLDRVADAQEAFARALDACQHAIVLDLNNAAAWNSKGYVLYLLGRFDDALAAARQAIALDPNNAYALSTVGEALNGLQRYDEALLYINQALSIDARLAEAWRDKALSLHALGREEEAQAAEAKANELDD